MCPPEIRLSAREQLDLQHALEKRLPLRGQAHLPSITDSTDRLRGVVTSATGTPARVARVRAEYPSQLDYSGFWLTAAAD